MWRHINRFVLWLPVAFGGAYAAAFGLIAAAAQANDPTAARYLRIQSGFWEAVLSLPPYALILFVGGVVGAWLIAFFYSSYLAERGEGRTAVSAPPPFLPDSHREGPQNRPNALTMRVGSAVLNPKPDARLSEAVSRTYKTLGGEPNGSRERSLFQHKVDLEIMDRLVQHRSHVWGRIGKRALQPLSIAEIERGVLDHLKGKMTVDIAGGARVYSDLHLSSLEIDLCWPDADKDARIRAKFDALARREENWPVVLAAANLRLDKLQRIRERLEEEIKRVHDGAKLFNGEMSWLGRGNTLATATQNFRKLIEELGVIASEVTGEAAVIGHPGYDENHERPAAGDREIESAEKRQIYRRLYDQHKEAEQLIGNLRAQLEMRKRQAEGRILEEGK